MKKVILSVMLAFAAGGVFAQDYESMEYDEYVYVDTVVADYEEVVVEDNPWEYKGYRSVLQAAKDGDASAALELGNRFREDDKLGNAEDALKWYKEAAKDKDYTAKAYIGMAEVYSNSSFYDYYDLDKCKEYYIKAYELGFNDALIALSLKYLNDLYDETSAIALLEAHADIPVCVSALADIYENSSYECYDMEKSVELRKKLAAMNEPYAAERVGDYYMETATHNYKEALTWYQMALDSESHSNSIFSSLGMIYSADDFEGKDFGKAMKLFEDAVALDDMDGYVGMAYLYAYGKGVDRDFEKAHELIDKVIEDYDMAYYHTVKGEFYSLEDRKDEALAEWMLAKSDPDAKKNPALEKYIFENYDSTTFEFNAFFFTIPIAAEVKEYRSDNLEAKYLGTEIAATEAELSDFNSSNIDELIASLKNELDKENAKYDLSKSTVDGREVYVLDAQMGEKDQCLFIHMIISKSNNPKTACLIGIMGENKDPKDIFDKIVKTIKWK